MKEMGVERLKKAHVTGKETRTHSLRKKKYVEITSL